MDSKIFKPALLVIALLLAFGQPGFAQHKHTKTAKAKKIEKSDKDDNFLDLNLKDLDLKLDLNLKPLVLNLNDLERDLKVEMDLKPLTLAMGDLKTDLKLNLKDLNTNLNLIGPDLKDLNTNLNIDLSGLKDLGENIRIDSNNDEIENGGDDSGPIEVKVKTYSKSYPADANDKLEITNKYGKVVVNTWNKNEFKVDVQIKAIANNDDTAQKLVDNTTISDSKDGDLVSFKTNFGANNSNGSIWKLFSNMNNSHRIEVNYTVYIPSKNALEIDNRYGAIILPDIEGKVEINSAYGSFEAKALSHPGNDIKVKYGSANINSLNSCNLSVGYGSLDLGSVDKLDGDFHYSSIKIDKIKSSADINARYAGTVEIGDLDRNFTSFAANTSYSSVKLGLNNATNADFDITTHYGGFDYNDLPVEITQKSPASEKGFHPTQSYKGHLGKGSAEKTISIRTSYGGVKFE